VLDWDCRKYSDRPIESGNKVSLRGIRVFFSASWRRGLDFHLKKQTMGKSPKPS
jgi:hypothetical protein